MVDNPSPSHRNPLKGRSAVTNGKRLYVVRPGDTAWARRFRDVLAEIISDLGGHDGGLSEGQRQLARRCATIAIACEKLEGEAAAGAAIDLETYGKLTDRPSGIRMRHMPVLGIRLDGGEGVASVTQVKRMAGHGFAPRQGAGGGDGSHQSASSSVSSASASASSSSFSISDSTGRGWRFNPRRWKARPNRRHEGIRVTKLVTLH